MYKKHKLLATSISAIQSDSQNAVSNATTAANAKFLTYENSTLGIKIQYPSNWTKQTARGYRFCCSTYRGQ